MDDLKSHPSWQRKGSKILYSSPFLKVQSVHINPLSIDGWKKKKRQFAVDIMLFFQLVLATFILELAIACSQSFQREV